MTSSNVTVQWGDVDCIHQNGEIIGYSVRYKIQGNGSTKTINVAEGVATKVVIFGLTNTTSYTLEVAAVNNAGIGVYSTPITHTNGRGKSSLDLCVYRTCTGYCVNRSTQWKCRVVPCSCHQSGSIEELCYSGNAVAVLSKHTKVTG